VRRRLEGEFYKKGEKCLRPLSDLMGSDPIEDLTAGPRCTAINLQWIGHRSWLITRWSDSTNDIVERNASRGCAFSCLEGGVFDYELPIRSGGQDA